ncbi:hypothetical protein EK21DRAFT_83926 [Setomelanomma holmii]|uniref:Uncharacterized protein n=1 Tax=Setomelanomma holmii TaxID=210430 RepID=A0A9P4HLI9_9PLEO|nr:hypothetical protein EK21DRAFT_83926 [Setomelanomma holmii]
MPDSPRLDSPLLPTSTRKLSDPTATLPRIPENNQHQPQYQAFLYSPTLLFSSLTPPTKYIFVHSPNPPSSPDSSPSPCLPLPHQTFPSCLSLPNLGHEDNCDDWSEGWDIESVDEVGNVKFVREYELPEIREGEWLYYPRGEKKDEKEIGKGGAKSCWSDDGSVKMWRRKLDKSGRTSQEGSGLRKLNGSTTSFLVKCCARYHHPFLIIELPRQDSPPPRRLSEILARIEAFFVNMNRYGHACGRHRPVRIPHTLDYGCGLPGEEYRNLRRANDCERLDAHFEHRGGSSSRVYQPSSSAYRDAGLSRDHRSNISEVRNATRAVLGSLYYFTDDAYGRSSRHYKDYERSRGWTDEVPSHGGAIPKGYLDDFNQKWHKDYEDRNADRCLDEYSRNASWRRPARLGGMPTYGKPVRPRTAAPSCRVDSAYHADQPRPSTRAYEYERATDRPPLTSSWSDDEDSFRKTPLQVEASIRDTFTASDSDILEERQI